MSSDDRPALSRVRATNTTLLALLAIAAGALVARLLFLGARVAHWDEGRVAYWILRYMETGDYSYRPIIHGPFFHHVNSVLFELFGASDFSMRLVVALIGGLLPLSAWLFRDRLRDSEMIALALLFAVNPVLLYYSRFMRNDLPLAAFMIFTLGFFVRLLDTRDRRYLYAGTATLALAFTTKESVLVYLLTWAGAVVLLFDHRLFRARAQDRSWVDVFTTRVRGTASEIRAWSVPLLVAVVEFFLIVTFFYAPRPDLWQAFSNPAMFPEVFGAATVGAWNEFFSTWVSGGHQADNVYLDYFEHFVDTLLFGAAPLVALAAVGFVVDRYSPAGPRDLVAFCSYWGVVFALGYPLITDIQAPWGPVHSVAPLAIPAAVGAALVYRWGLEAYEREDTISVALSLVLVIALTAQVAATAVETSYVDPYSDDNELVQYVQPPAELRETIETIDAVAGENGGTDVLFYGDTYGQTWSKRLPLPWYLERNEVETSSAVNESQFPQDPPPVVIGGTDDRSFLDGRLQGYESTERGMAYHTKEIVVYVDRGALGRAGR